MRIAFLILGVVLCQHAIGQTLEEWPFEHPGELPTNDSGQRDIWVETEDVIGLDSTTVWTGTSSLRIDCQSGDCGIRYRISGLDSLGGTALLLSGMVKTANSDDSGPAYFMAGLFNHQRRRVDNHSTWEEGPREHSDWDEMRLHIPVPEDASTLQIWITTNGVGTTWYDEVALEAIPWGRSEAVKHWLGERAEVWTNSWYAWLLALLAYAAIPALVVAQGLRPPREPDELGVPWPLRWFGLVMATICGPFVFWSFEDIVPDFLSPGGWYWDYTLLSLLFGSIACWVWYQNRQRLSAAHIWRNAVLVIRFMLIATFISYAFAKFFRSQFAPLNYAQLDMRIGDVSSMQLLWIFFGHSFPYVLFAGISQVVGAFFLVFRRTYVLGAMILFGVVSNIVFVNFAYDIPVKYPSTVFLLLIVVLLFEEAPRLWGLLVQRAESIPAPVRHPRVFPKPWGAVTGLAVFGILMLHANSLYTGYLEDWDPHPDTHPVAGVWTVVERSPEPASETLEGAWDRLIINHNYAWVGLDDRRRMLNYYQRSDSLGTMDMLFNGATDTLRFHYTLATDTLVLRGASEGDSVFVRLNRKSFVLEP